MLPRATRPIAAPAAEPTPTCSAPGPDPSTVLARLTPFGLGEEYVVDPALLGEVKRGGSGNPVGGSTLPSWFGAVWRGLSQRRHETPYVRSRQRRSRVLIFCIASSEIGRLSATPM